MIYECFKRKGKGVRGRVVEVKGSGREVRGRGKGVRGG